MLMPELFAACGAVALALVEHSDDMLLFDLPRSGQGGPPRTSWQKPVDWRGMSKWRTGVRRAAVEEPKPQMIGL